MYTKYQTLGIEESVYDLSFLTILINFSLYIYLPHILHIYIQNLSA